MTQVKYPSEPECSAAADSIKFHDYFGLGQATAGTGVVFGIYTVGSVCAFFLNVWLPDTFGRRYGMFIPNILAWYVVRFIYVLRTKINPFSTGAIITANASGMPMFLGGRWLTVS